MPRTELAVTVPLTELKRVVAIANRLGKQYCKAPDVEALEVIEREIAQVEAVANAASQV